MYLYNPHVNILKQSIMAEKGKQNTIMTSHTHTKKIRMLKFKQSPILYRELSQKESSKISIIYSKFFLFRRFVLKKDIQLFIQLCLKILVSNVQQVLVCFLSCKTLFFIFQSYSIQYMVISFRVRNVNSKHEMQCHMWQFFL